MTTHPIHNGDRSRGPGAAPVTPTQLAADAAEAVRFLNHATRRSQAWQWPADLYSTVGYLHVLAYRLPQTFAQITQWLDTQQRAGRIGHDQSDSPEVSILLTGAALATAEHHATQLAQALAIVHTETSHLTGVLDPDADGGE